MKLLLRALLLALPFLAVPAQAHADGCCSGCCTLCPGQVLARFFLCGTCDGCGCKAGPWYSYWPYEAHFQTPAHPQFPYWPVMTSGGPGHGPFLPGPSYQPVGYYPSPPAYWYGR